MMEVWYNVMFAEWLASGKQQQMQASTEVMPLRAPGATGNWSWNALLCFLKQNLNAQKMTSGAGAKCSRWSMCLEHWTIGGVRQQGGLNILTPSWRDSSQTDIQMENSRGNVNAMIYSTVWGTAMRLCSRTVGGDCLNQGLPLAEWDCTALPWKEHSFPQRHEDWRIAIALGHRPLQYDCATPGANRLYKTTPITPSNGHRKRRERTLASNDRQPV